MSRDVDAARNPHTISQPLQTFHEFLQPPGSAVTTDDPDVKTELSIFDSPRRPSSSSCAYQ
jgi:hypothetical protein